jgi:hypothetical protein
MADFFPSSQSFESFLSNLAELGKKTADFFPSHPNMESPLSKLVEL